MAYFAMLSGQVKRCAAGDARNRKRDSERRWGPSDRERDAAMLTTLTR
jgi:hypothetical protein